MRILLINPNTSESATDLVVGHVRAIAGEEAEFVSVTARFDTTLQIYAHSVDESPQRIANMRRIATTGSSTSSTSSCACPGRSDATASPCLWSPFTSTAKFLTEGQKAAGLLYQQFIDRCDYAKHVAKQKAAQIDKGGPLAWSSRKTSPTLHGD